MLVFVAMDITGGGKGKKVCVVFLSANACYVCYERRCTVNVVLHFTCTNLICSCKRHSFINTPVVIFTYVFAVFCINVVLPV